MSSDNQAELQHQIENIDTQLYNLLIERTKLVKKQPNNAIENTLGKEAASIKRLLKNHTGDFPEYVIAKIWREILSASACLEDRLKFSVFAAKNDDSLIRIMQEHFGSYIDYVTYTTFGAVINELNNHETQLAIIPCDNAQMNSKPWWSGFSMSNKNDSLKIVAKLPFIRRKEDKDSKEVYVVALSSTDQSGADISLLSVELNKDTSTSAIIENLEASGFKGAKILNMVAINDDDKSCLIEVNGYITSETKSFKNSSELFKNVDIVGAYAEPIKL